MNARKKLNTANMYGALFLAALSGAVFQSWFVFLIVAGVLILGDLYAGHIRPGPE